MSARCRIITLPDGTTARVQGNIEPEALQAIKDALPVLCGDPSSVPMPPIAQRMHGRETYTCGLPEGHNGLHSWPGVPSWSGGE